jgi:DNA repair photolyase
MKQVIYETKGRAREFNELAINLFTGCGHQCIYCYGADVTHQTKDDFENRPRIRVTALDVLHSAKEWVAKGETRRVLLCFVTDPYQPLEQETQLTRKCIMALHECGLNVVILTKGGRRSMRDFDLLTSKDAYATTLTLTNDPDSLHWEPYAAIPSERIEALVEAHKRGIETWVSFEPVIYPEQTTKLLMLTREFIGHAKIGKLNYHPQGKTVNWRKFGWSIKGLMDGMGVKYYFKNDLIKEMGVLPSTFHQTFVCH